MLNTLVSCPKGRINILSLPLLANTLDSYPHDNNTPFATGPMALMLQQAFGPKESAFTLFFIGKKSCR